MWVISKRTILVVAVIILTAITAAICFTAINGGSAGADKSGLTVVLDAGHGGIDGGVTGVNTGVKESELNLLIVKKLRDYLEDAGFKVVLTRSSDAGLYGLATSGLKRKDMEKRRDIIVKANPALVVSVHLNKYSVSTRRGAQVFYKAGDKNGKKLAESIQEEFNGMDTSERAFSALTGDYYILNCTDYPSVIAECGFLSNPEDESLLVTEEYRDSLCYSMFKGIVRYIAESAEGAA